MRVILCCALLLGCSDEAPKNNDAETTSTDTASSGTTGSEGEDGGSGAGGEGDGTDTGGSDGGTDSGGGGDDTGGEDGGDATGGDEGTADEWPIDGMGTLSGSCGDYFDPILLADPTPLLLQTELDLGTDGFDPDALSAGGTEVWTDGNLGGSSVESEVVAYEVLYRCEAAVLLKTEAEITYTDSGGKKTDLLVEIDGVRLGVSVTRAVGWPQDDPYTVDQATDLLTDKLADIPLSTANVDPADAWSRQILSVVAFAPEHATSIETAWTALDDATRGDTILFVTATNGDDAELY